MFKGKTLLLASCALVVAGTATAHAQTAAQQTAGQQTAGQAAAQAAPSAAADSTAPAAESDAQQADIVVTGTVRPERKIDTSISVSSVSAETLLQINPQSSADLIRFIPGIRSEASGGEGNANISVRGLPVASGGAKFVQFQEDGLPVMLFGDVSFATADTFVKTDYNIARVEAVRGGSASTAADNAPGAILNFITKTGQTDGGSIGITRGVNFDRTRVDADYGGSLGDGWRFHIGGFYHNGEGVKKDGITGENGGQVKANLTHSFANGFIRLDVKFLDDRSPVYLPVPVAFSRSGTSASYSSIPGFDVRSGALQSPALTSLLALDANGNRITDHVSDGYRTLTKAFGGEASFDLGSGISFDDKFRYAINSGKFVGPYPANVDLASNIAAGIGGAGSTVSIASGPNAGTAYSGYAVNTVYFDVTLNNFNTFTNDLRLSKEIDGGSAGRFTVTAGYTKSGQHIGMDWHWTNYLLTAQDRGNAQLLDVRNAAGVLQTQNGLIAYDARAFGDCCVRNYDVEYSVDAPWANLNWKVGRLTLDGSLRYDIQSARGTYRESAGVGTPIDVNQDGVITVPEQRVLTVTSGNPQPVDYTKRYLSYSVGANLEILPELALFGRASRGARFNADRVLPGNAAGDVSTLAALNFANQQEAGAKFRVDHFSGALTLFHTTTAERGSDITPAGLILFARNYRAQGAEFEGSANYSVFSLYGGVTYTDAKITADNFAGANDIGNRPQRQAKFVYQLRPTITLHPVDLGATLVGTSDSYTDSSNTLKQPGYTVVGLFADVAIVPRVHVIGHVDNLFNVIGITEVDQGPSATGSSVGSARSILGRQISIGARVDF